MHRFFPAICLLFVLASCSGVESHDIVLDGIPAVPASHEELANNVFIEKPHNYYRARKFTGFQDPNGPATVSLEIRDSPLVAIERLFESDALRARGEELLEYSEVDFYGNKEAFFARTKAKRKGVYKLLLAVHQNGKTYNIKALCGIRMAEALGNDVMLKNILLSTRIADYRAESTDFELAEDLLVEQIYTRDGQYPTEAPDSASAIISVYAIPASGNPDTLRSLIQQRLTALAGQPAYSVQMEPLNSGFLFHGTAYGDSLSAFVAIGGIRGEVTGMLMTGTALSKEGADNVREFILDKSVKNQLGGR